ncbi:hypothetical protein BH10PSE3_BH10PSE3_09280 [soil metagenome]
MPETKPISRTGRQVKLEGRVLVAILVVILLAGAGWFVMGQTKSPTAAGTRVDPTMTAPERPGH